MLARRAMLAEWPAVPVTAPQVIADAVDEMRRIHDAVSDASMAITDLAGETGKPFPAS